MRKRISYLLLLFTYFIIPTLVIAEERSWSYKDWYVIENKEYVRYYTKGIELDTHYFGFIKYKNNYHEDILWSSWSTWEDGLEEFKGQDVTVLFQTDTEHFQLAIPLTNIYKIAPQVNVFTLSDFVAGDKLILLLKNENKINTTLISPSKLTNKIPTITDTFSLNGFIAARLKAEEVCDKLTAHTNSILQTISNAPFSKTVTFKEFHDPGWLLTEDNQSFYFHYKGFTYENISTWKRGRKLFFYFTPKEGVMMFDQISGAKATVEQSGKHPIELITEESLKKNTSTMGMAGVYSEEYDRWDSELNRIYKILRATYTPEEFKTIQKMQRSWLQYRDNRNEVNGMIHNKDQGTITIIESNYRPIAPLKSQVLFLQSLLKH